MVCVQYVLLKKKLLYQIKGWQKRQTISYFLSCVYSKEQVFQEVDNTISDLPQKGQGGLFNIDEDPVSEGDEMF